MAGCEPVVFIVDDNRSICESATELLAGVGLNVRGFCDPQGLLDACEPDQPGCLVTDMRLPGLSGLELEARLREKGCRLPFVVISGCADVGSAVRAIQAGAVDYIEKPFDGQLLIDAVNEALRRDAEARSRRAFRSRVRARIESLSRRERQVGGLLAAGKTSKEIAYELKISPKTADFHRSNLLRKMQVRSVVELVLLVYGARGAGSVEELKV